jgi:hypothetical protein
MDACIMNWMKEVVDTLQECGDDARSISEKVSFWFYECRERAVRSWSDHFEFLVRASATLEE